MPGDGGSTIVLIVLMLLVIFAAYFTTKFLSSKARNITKTKYIHVRDRMFIGRDRHIILIEVGKEAYLVGVTNQTFSVIGTLHKDELVPVTEEQSASVISGLKGFMGKFAGFMKNAGGAQEELRKARMQYKQEKAAEKAPEKAQDTAPEKGSGKFTAKSAARETEEDDIEKIIEALNRRKSRLSDGGRREDDEQHRRDGENNRRDDAQHHLGVDDQRRGDSK